MTESPSLAHLLEQAGDIFQQAETSALAVQQDWRAIREAEESEELRLVDEPRTNTDSQADSAGDAEWDRHAAAFGELTAALGALPCGADNPPEVFEVASQLEKLGRILGCIHKPATGETHSTLSAKSAAYAACLNNFGKMNVVVMQGKCAIEDAIAAMRREEEIAQEKPSFMLLDQCRATPDGHIAFLEFVRDDVHFAAEMKRNQNEERYSNDTLGSAIHVDLWAGARERIAALTDLRAEGVEEVARVLRWELTVGTLEQIDDMLGPVVRGLRDAWQVSRDAAEFIDEASQQPLGICEEVDHNVSSKKPDADHRPEITRELGDHTVLNALAQHHRYRDGKIQHREPIVAKSIAEQLAKGCPQSTSELQPFVSHAFTRLFPNDQNRSGFKEYKIMCRNEGLLVNWFLRQFDDGKAFGTSRDLSWTEGTQGEFDFDRATSESRYDGVNERS